MEEIQYSAPLHLRAVARVEMAQHQMLDQTVVVEAVVVHIQDLDQAEAEILHQHHHHKETMVVQALLVVHHMELEAVAVQVPLVVMVLPLLEEMVALDCHHRFLVYHPIMVAEVVDQVHQAVQD
jgi:hypothetical protein